jgi:two-component system, chemotaxis family, response regulator PixG
MQATVNIPLTLKQLVGSQNTGCFEIFHNNVTWQVVLQFGQLLTADCSVQSLIKPISRLRQLGCDEVAKTFSTITKTNRDLSGVNLVRQELDRLVAQGKLERSAALQISMEVTKEAIESLFWLQAGTHEWKEKSTTGIDFQNIGTRTDLLKLIEYYQQRLTVWQKYITFVQSPHQRPYVTQHKSLEKPLPNGALSLGALNQVTQLMRGITLRELALLLNQDELKVVQLLMPYIRENIVCLREPAHPLHQLSPIPELNSNHSAQAQGTISLDRDVKNANTQSGVTKTYKIACIDDSPIVLDEIERFLHKNSNYVLTKIEDPIRASSLIFRLQPDLILMDITMPNINGYKLCQLLRDSYAFKQTPIIMVSGNKGLVDKVRAQLVGATDYLTKPFTEAELMELVGKYLT